MLSLQPVPPIGTVPVRSGYGRRSSVDPAGGARVEAISGGRNAGASTPAASIPSSTAPTTGGMVSRTKRAPGATAWIVSAIGSKMRQPPLCMLPTWTTSNSRSSNPSCRITPAARLPSSRPDQVMQSAGYRVTRIGGLKDQRRCLRADAEFILAQPFQKALRGVARQSAP